MIVTVRLSIFCLSLSPSSFSQIDKLTSLDRARLLYINEEGNAVALESNGEYLHVFVLHPGLHVSQNLCV